MKTFWRGGVRQKAGNFGERARPGRSRTRLAFGNPAPADDFDSQAQPRSCSARGRAEPQPGRLCSPFVLFAAILICAGKICAADVSANFSAANELYAKGKFADAAAVYEKILQTGGQSPALLFNYGNAEFKAGKLGKAIAAYRRAELLTPRDAELRANLAFVRNQVQGATVRESRWRDWIGALTLNEGAWLTAALFWLTLALLIARQLRPAFAPKLRGVTRLAVALTICAGAVLALQAADHFNSSVAVVTGAEATARSGPFDDAQTAFTARDGAELSVLDRHGDWIQVTDSAGKTGWLNTAQAEVLPGA